MKPKITLIYRTRKSWLGDPPPDSPIRNLSERAIAFLVGLTTEPEIKPIASMRGTPPDYPAVAHKESAFEVAGCKRVTWFSLAELDAVLPHDAKTGKQKVTSGLSYFHYLDKEFFMTLHELRLLGVERVILGFN